VSLRTRFSTFVCALALVGAFTPRHAAARRQYEIRYPVERVWNTALRMVRVDMRLPVTDRDQEAGYLLFEYIESDRKYPGSIEIISSEKDKRPLITVIVNVSGMPSYVEQMMLDKLEKKLNAEYGAPMEPPKEAPPAKEPEKKPESDREAPVAPVDTL